MNVKVGGTKRMTTLTMRLPSIETHDGIADPHVFSVRNSPQMRRICASSIATDVIYFCPGGDWANEHLIRCAVRVSQATPKPETAIPAGKTASCPTPTMLRVTTSDLRKKSLLL